MATKKLSTERETDIQFVICQYLFEIKHYFGWRMNTTPVFDTTRGVFRAMPKFSMRGLPDIFVMHKGTMYGIEVKTKKGVVSDNQKAFKDGFEKAGGRYFVVRSLDEVLEIL